MSIDTKTATLTPDNASLLNALCRLASDTLARQSGNLFVSMRQALIDLAGSTPMASEQQRFLEAMREMSLAQEELQADFLARIFAGFARVGRPVASSPAPAFRAESLELVSAEEVERHVLATGMANRTRNRAQKALFQLHERMLRITPSPFEEQDNPFDPANIAAAFLEASARWNSESGILRPLCSRFEAEVLSDVEELYAAANDILIAAGVLADLSPLARPARKAEAPPTPSAARMEPETPPEAGTTNATWQEITGLLSRLRHSATPLPSGFAGTASAAQPASLNAAGLSRLVGELQGRTTWLDTGTGTPDIRAALAAIAAESGRLTLAAADQDTIGLVTMFFDMVNVDRNLPLEVQALIGRLQLPVLRLALQDRSFFADAEHPARQLIDLMARAGLGWDPESGPAQETLLAHLQRVVDDVLIGDNDLSTYRAAAARLAEHATRTEQRAMKIERRTAEKAEAEARTAAARDAVYEALRERLDGTDLPAPVLDFLMQDWQRVMQLFHLRKGRGSPEWLDALQAIDDLRASVLAPPRGARQEELEAQLQQLYARLASGLNQTQSHTADAEARVDVIRALHRELLDDSRKNTRPVPLVPVSVTPPAPIPPRGTPRPDPLGGGRAIGEVLMFESLQKADAVPAGTWFEYKDPRSGITRRCKLSARIEESRTLIFSDRSGATVWEKSRKLFAYELQIGFLTPVEDSSLVDRTLGRIAESLREGTGARQ